MTEKEIVIEEKENFESKLIPVLRDGVEAVKMILFLQLKKNLAKRRADWSAEHRGKIIGAVLNELFGIVNPDQIFVDFSIKYKKDIEGVLQAFPKEFEDMLIPLTDSLRITVLCDHQEGIDNSAILAKAKTRGVLLEGRDLPLPHTYIDLVRRLGSAYGLFMPVEGDG